MVEQSFQCEFANRKDFRSFQCDRLKILRVLEERTGKGFRVSNFEAKACNTVNAKTRGDICPAYNRLLKNGAKSKYAKVIQTVPF
jgi:hypothetical protein